MSAVLETERDRSTCIYLEKFANGNVSDHMRDDLKTYLLKGSKNDGSKFKEKRIMVTESASTGMTYIGKNFGADSLHVNNMTKYYVGVYDKKTGKMQICDTELFHMKPYIASTDTVDAPSTDKRKSYIEKVESLVEAFGSKRKKTSFEKKYLNQMDAETVKGVMAADVEHGAQKLSERSMEAERSVTKQMETVADLPQCNREGKTPEETYPLSVVITDAELDCLQTLATEMFDSTSAKVKEWTASEKFPSYILKHLSMLPMDADVRWKKCKLLMYLHYMITLYILSPAGLNKSKVFEDLPALIRNKLYNNFTIVVRKSRCKPSRLKDRLAAFVLVLCLHLDEFCIDTDPISKALHLSQDKLHQVLRALGCRVVKKVTDGTETSLGKMTVPLSFPSPRKMKKGRKGGR